MQQYITQIDVRWADLDPNFHVLHSKYYDFGATCRMNFLTEHGITVPQMLQHHIGPIIFREECIFKREIRFGDKITVTLCLDKLSADYRKWTMVHELLINEGELAALITVDGAWMDTKLRKVAPPPPIFATAFEAIPKTGAFKPGS